MKTEAEPAEKRPVQRVPVRSRLLRPPQWLRRHADLGFGFCGIGVVLIAWWAISLTLPPVRLPGPIPVLETAVKQIHSTGSAAFMLMQTGNKGILPDCAYTATNVAIALPSGALLGVSIGILVARVQWFRLLFGPIVIASAMVPMVVLAPVSLIIFGPSRVGSLALVILSSLIVMAFTSRNAAESVPPYYAAWAQSLGASRGAVLRTVVLPASVPGLIGGLRVALAIAWGLEAFVEILGAPSGLGQVIEIENTVSNTTAVMAAVVWLAILAVASDALIVAGSKLRIRWQEVAHS